jgi:hypothetical protein
MIGNDVVDLASSKKKKTISSNERVLDKILPKEQLYYFYHKSRAMVYWNLWSRRATYKIYNEEKQGRELASLCKIACNYDSRKFRFSCNKRRTLFYKNQYFFDLYTHYCLNKIRRLFEG